MIHETYYMIIHNPLNSSKASETIGDLNSKYIFDIIKVLH